MNLYPKLEERTSQDGPIRVAVIGAGKFASMFLTQASTMEEIHVVGVADLDTDKARDSLRRTGWAVEQYSAQSVAEALAKRTTFVTDDSSALIDIPEIEVVLEVTGNPIVGVEHALQAIDNKHHIVMVNVEADCLVGPLLAARAREAGVVYSMAYGDQPALICELVDWCRTVGFDVVSAGKGTKYLPEYHHSTPDTVWDYYGFTQEQLASGDFNPKMFNSFLDGTKSAIEMAAVANATGLRPQAEGLQFPPSDVDELPTIFRPTDIGGVLTQDGTVEIASSLRRDGSEIERDLRWGVYVTFRGRTEYAKQCFAEYGVHTDDTGTIGALYRPYHMIGLELGVSIAAAVLRGEPTGVATEFHGDVMSIAKKDLEPGEVLDGEGGFTVYGRLAPAATSVAADALPIGLTAGVRLRNPVKAGDIVRMADVELDEKVTAVRMRRELAELFSKHGSSLGV